MQIQIHLNIYKETSEELLITVAHLRSAELEDFYLFYYNCGFVIIIQITLIYKMKLKRFKLNYGTTQWQESCENVHRYKSVSVERNINMN